MNRLSLFQRVQTGESRAGLVLLVAAVIGFLWANSPWRETFHALSGWQLGPAFLHLNLSASSWISDGLLAVFFFVVGMELKHELVAGSLRSVREVAVPVCAAVGGMAVPAALFTAIVLLGGAPGAVSGWATPTATDIAFALAVLAVCGRGLPDALRTFLLTLAVVDDLLAISVIAVFYTGGVNPLFLALALCSAALFGVLVRLRRLQWWLLLPVALLAWYFMHLSGVHATIAGVVLGAVVPARVLRSETEARTERLGDLVRPWSTYVALPAFALVSSGVTVIDADGGSGFLGQPVFIAVALALVVGKFLGVVGTTALVTKTTPLRLSGSLRLRDMVPLGFLAGIGFTVALLIADLGFSDKGQSDAAKVAILIASVCSGVLGAFSLRWTARRMQRHQK